MQEGDLSPKVTPLLILFPQQRRQFCDTVGELTRVLRFIFANVSIEQESPSTFILSNKERKKAHKN